MKINPGSPIVTDTPTTTRCRGAFNLHQACTRRRARSITDATPKQFDGLLAIPLDRSWESLGREYPDHAGVDIEGVDVDFVDAQLTLVAASGNAHLDGRFRLVDSDVLVVEGDLVTAEQRHVHLVGPHVLLLAPAA